MIEKKERTPHPWGDFLHYRRNAIIWMREEMGYDDKRIAHDLSMDEMQVYLIRVKSDPTKPRES